MPVAISIGRHVSQAPFSFTLVGVQEAAHRVPIAQIGVSAGTSTSQTPGITKSQRGWNGQPLTLV